MGIGLILLGLWARRPVSDQRRSKVGQKWAVQHLAFVTGPLTTTLDAHFAQRRRRVWILVIAMGAVCLWIGATGLSLSDGGFLLIWVCIIVIGSLTAAATAAAVARTSLGQRARLAAHVRAVEISDYAPSVMRWNCVVAGVFAGAAATVFVGLTVQGRVPLALGALAATSAILVVCGAAIAEWSVRQIAHTPEPAIDAAHLYWQDALRSESIKNAYIQVPLWAAQVAILGANFVRSSDPWLWTSVFWLSSFVMVVLALASAISGIDPLSFRKRLWPTLAPGQVLMPGDMPPRAGARIAA